MEENIKKILKFYGLQRTGTNVLYWLLTINFKEYVCDIAEHGAHYLGWKHWDPPSQNVISEIEHLTKEKIYFIFTHRKYDDWISAVKNRHQNTWDFPERWSGSQKFIMNSPNGPELYDSPYEFYIKRQGKYKEFCELYPEQSIMIDFEELQTDQKNVILKIKNKFDLKLQYDQPIEIKKKINMSGHWEDFIN